MDMKHKNVFVNLSTILIICHGYIYTCICFNLIYFWYTEKIKQTPNYFMVKLWYRIQLIKQLHRQIAVRCTDLLWPRGLDHPGPKFFL